MRDTTFEESLILGLRRGEPGAVADLAKLYQDRIYQLAWRCVGNREDAEEVTQDVLLKVCRTVDRFRGDAALSSWIYRITFNTAMSRLRRLRAMRETISDEVQTDDGLDEGMPRRREAVDWSMSADERVMWQQLRARLASAMRDLPMIYRAPIILRDLQGLSTEEASRALRVKDQTLKSRLHRGRHMLRRRLSDLSGAFQPRRDAPMC
jgi:RNA polymerase sigma-70 factor, ECF subfamily